MIKKDFQRYATQTWQDDSYIKSLSEISRPGSKKAPLIDRSEKVYCFDSICNEIYPENKPTSADGLFFCNNTAYFVEFKTGYKKIITKDNYCIEQAKCPSNNSTCQEHQKWFFALQNKETEELNQSIKFKAIESYITLEKQILPLCESNGKKFFIKFYVVIDADDTIEHYENILFGLSENHKPTKTEKSNIISKLENSLCNYKLKKDKNSPENDYFYDEIKIMTAREFEMFFDGLLPDMITPSNTEPQTV